MTPADQTGDGAFDALVEKLSRRERFRRSLLGRIVRRLRPGRDESSAPGAARQRFLSREESLRRAAIPSAVSGPVPYSLVAFPAIEWTFRYQRPQQLLSRFARDGHRVFYVSPRFRPRGEPWELTPRAENVFEVSLRAPRRNVYRDEPGPAATGSVLASLDRFRRDLSLSSAAALVQLPFWGPIARRAARDAAWPLVYDCIDLHGGFSTNVAAMVDHERALLEGADLVTATSEALRVRAAKLNPRVRIVRNAADFERFASAPHIRRARPVVGYHGAIADWFDVPLVEEIARRCPDIDFLLVGSTYGADVRRLGSLENVRCVGERPYSEIPGWVGRFDVAIIPFRRTDLTEATNPVKAYEVFASGSPLVSVPLPELETFEGLVRFASDASGFEKEIRAALAEAPGGTDARKEFARRHTWAARHREMASSIDALFAPGPGSR